MTFSKTLFTPITTEPVSDATAINDSLACVNAFTNAFNRRDLEAMDALLHFPHVILSAEKLVIWNAPGALPPDFFNDLAREDRMGVHGISRQSCNVGQPMQSSSVGGVFA